MSRGPTSTTDRRAHAARERLGTHDVVLFAPTDTLTPAQRSQLVARAVGIVEGGPAWVLVQDDHMAVSDAIRDFNQGFLP